MSKSKKFTSYLGITIGSLALIANTIALTVYYSSLSPLIVGGIIGSTLPLIVCTLISILSLFADKNSLNKIYGGIYDQERINKKAELFNELGKKIVPSIVGSIASFGVGAGLAALSFTSPTAIIVLTLIANAVITSLVSKVTERFSSPPSGGLVDIEVDNSRSSSHIFC